MYLEDLKESLLPECFVVIFFQSHAVLLGIAVREDISLSFTILVTIFLSQKPAVLLMGVRKIFNNHDIGKLLQQRSFS